MTFQELHERLLSWATAEPRREDLLAARRNHFGRHGEPHEEDRTYQPRLDGMLDFYLYDFRLRGGGGTTLERFLEAEGGALDPQSVSAYRALGESVHRLFEVRKLAEGLVRLRDAFSGEDRDVAERRHVAGLEKGDLLEARLLRWDGKLIFSGAFLYHPREARKAILAEVKKRRKAAGKGGTVDVEEFLAQLSRMAMKVERYRNVRLESIYDFSPDVRTFTPRPVPKD